MLQRHCCCWSVSIINDSVYNYASTDTGEAVWAHDGAILQSAGTLLGLPGVASATAGAAGMCVVDDVSSVTAEGSLLAFVTSPSMVGVRARLTGGLGGVGAVVRAVHSPRARHSHANAGMAQAAMQPSTHAPMAAQTAAPIISQLNTTPVGGGCLGDDRK